MPIYSINGNALDTCYGVGGDELDKAYDVEGNVIWEKYVPPVYTHELSVVSKSYGKSAYALPTVTSTYYWADDDGIIAGITPITDSELPITCCMPDGATHLENSDGSVRVDCSRMTSAGNNIIKKFGAISDSHLGATRVTKTYDYLSNFVDYCHNNGYEMLFCGDTNDAASTSNPGSTSSNNGRLLALGNKLTSYGMDIYATIGNHEVNGTNASNLQHIWYNCLYNHKTTADTSEPANYNGGARMIDGDGYAVGILDALKMGNQSGRATTAFDPDGAIQFDNYFEAKLSENKPIIVLQHYVPYQYNSTYYPSSMQIPTGSGVNVSGGYIYCAGHGASYSDTSNWHNDDTTLQWWEALAKARATDRVIWCHGHSHFTSQLQKTDSIQHYNHCVDKGIFGNVISIHIPSFCTNSDSSRTMINDNDSEWAIITLYDTGVKVQYYHNDANGNKEAYGNCCHYIPFG